MINRFRRSGGALALAASLSMLTTPAMAAGLPATGPVAGSSTAFELGLPDTVWNSADDTVQRHRRYNPWGHRNRRLDVDAGDVIAGILILGTIAAVADSANRNRDNRRDRDEGYRSERREDNPRYGDWNGNRNTQGYGQASEIDRAADLCLDEAGREAARRDGERSAQQGRISGVTSEGNGWRVDGTVGSRSFTCGTSDGRIDYVRVGDGTAEAGDYNGQEYNPDYSFADPAQ